MVADTYMIDARLGDSCELHVALLRRTGELTDRREHPHSNFSHGPILLNAGMAASETGAQRPLDSSGATKCLKPLA